MRKLALGSVSAFVGMYLVADFVGNLQTMDQLIGMARSVSVAMSGIIGMWVFFAFAGWAIFSVAWPVRAERVWSWACRFSFRLHGYRRGLRAIRAEIVKVEAESAVLLRPRAKLGVGESFDAHGTYNHYLEAEKLLERWMRLRATLERYLESAIKRPALERAALPPRPVEDALHQAHHDVITKTIDWTDSVGLQFGRADLRATFRLDDELDPHVVALAT